MVLALDPRNDLTIGVVDGRITRGVVEKCEVHPVKEVECSEGLSKLIAHMAQNAQLIGHTDFSI